MAVINNPIAQRPFEVIRDRIANILADELWNQSVINYDESLDATIYTERFVPFDRSDMPCVNVMLTRGNFDNYKAIDKDGTYQFFIDVYHRASTTDAVGADEMAHRNLHRLIGVIDAILSDTRYVTLGYERPFISRVEVTEIKVAEPKDDHDAQSVAMGRVFFSVRVPSSVESIQPRFMAGYDTQVKIGTTDSGYIYSGSNIPVPEPTCEPVLIYLANGTVIATVNSGGEYFIPDTPVTVTDQDGNELGSGDVPSVTGGNIEVTIAPSGDGDAVLKDTDGNVLSTTPVPPETTVDIIAPDGTVNVNKSDGVLISAVTVASGGTEPYNVADSTAVLKDTDGTTISTTPIKATESEDIVAPDVDIEINGVNEGSVVSGGTAAINLVDSGGDPVTPDSVTVVGDTFTVEVPSGGGGCTGTAGMYSTGQAASFGDGDDSNINQDYWTLPTGKVNVWGHNYRWCGITGGYTDGVGYFDVDGVATTKVLAFPETLVCDLGHVDCDGNFPMYQYNFQLTSNVLWDSARATCIAFSTVSFPTGWRMHTRIEAMSLFYQANAWNLQQKPFESLGLFYSHWTGTTKNGTSNAYIQRNDLQYTDAAKGAASGRAFPARTTNISEL